MIKHKYHITLHLYNYQHEPVSVYIPIDKEEYNQITNGHPYDVVHKYIYEDNSKTQKRN